MRDRRIDPEPRAPDPALAGRKVVFLVTEDWYFCSHRLPIARAARDAGMEVVVATRVDRHREVIEREGFRLASLPWRRRSKNPVAELRSLAAIAALYRRERPDLVHHVAMKPTLYGAVAARIARVERQIDAIAGFGFVFTSTRARARFLRPVFRLAFRVLVNRAGVHVIVQNPDDRDALVAARAATVGRTHLIRGSGVDIDRFRPTPEPDGTPRAILVSRMLWSKGIGETVEAARLLARRGVDLRVVLVGDCDPENPESIPREILERWRREGVVEWRGAVDDTVPVWSEAAFAVLPSYREGLPKTLLEAGACGRAAVTTNVPGCREVVIDGENGILVARGEAGPLADAMERLATDAKARRAMGEKARARVEAAFTEGAVVDETLSLYRTLLGGEA